MSRAGTLRRFARHERGASAAEFALILPLFLLFFVGLLDAGRWMFEVNRGEKATQIGARFAVVTNPLPKDLADKNFIGVTVGGVTLGQGDRIPAAALDPIACNQAGCSSFGYDSAAFGTLLGRIQQILPSVRATNLVVEYRGSGLGYAGNPYGMDISPLVTVRLTGLTFSSLLLLGGTVTMPDFAYTLTMEDGQGTSSN